MDNLTHSLAGAVLGQTGLKRRTGLAMPALIIGANIPDIDAIATVFGTQSLAMRRGLTHGLVALLILPLLLTGALLLWARWRPNDRRLPVRPGWLLALAYLGTLSHPALDWLNSYGIRLLEPFSSQWFAGDTLFIIDVWLWAALIAGVWLSRRRERAGRVDWRAPAVASFSAICVYIIANGLITARAEGLSAARLEGRLGQPVLVVANPVPVAFWQREIFWRTSDVHGAGHFAMPSTLSLDPFSARSNGVHLAALRQILEQDVDARAFLFWSRMPVVEQHGDELVLTDQRFSNSLARGNFEVRVPTGADR